MSYGLSTQSPPVILMVWYLELVSARDPIFGDRGTAVDSQSTRGRVDAGQKIFHQAKTRIKFVFLLHSRVRVAANDPEKNCKLLHSTMAKTIVFIVFSLCKCSQRTSPPLKHELAKKPSKPLVSCGTCTLHCLCMLLLLHQKTYNFTSGKRKHGWNSHANLI